MDRSCRFQPPINDQMSLVSLKTQWIACQRTELGSKTLEQFLNLFQRKNGLHIFSFHSLSNVSRCSHCNKFQIKCLNDMLSNGNRTEWSPIRSVIIRVITKSDDRAAGVRFVYHEYDYRPNWTTRSPITN